MATPPALPTNKRTDSLAAMLRLSIVARPKRAFKNAATVGDRANPNGVYDLNSDADRLDADFIGRGGSGKGFSGGVFHARHQLRRLGRGGSQTVGPNRVQSQTNGKEQTRNADRRQKTSIVAAEIREFFR